MYREVQDYITYLIEEKQASANTLAAYEKDLKKAVAYFEGLGVTEADRVTEFNIQSYMLHMETQQFKNSTISRQMAVLRSFFGYLFMERRIETDPTRRIKPPKVEKKAPTVLSEAQIEALFACPDTETVKGIRDRAMLKLLYATGIQVSELMELKANDINLKLNCVHIGGEAGRIVPFDESARESLIRYIGAARPRLARESGSEYLFLNYAGEQMTRQGFWKLVKGYAGMAGLSENITPQQLRHSLEAYRVKRFGF